MIKRILLVIAIVLAVVFVPYWIGVLANLCFIKIDIHPELLDNKFSFWIFGAVSFVVTLTFSFVIFRVITNTIYGPIKDILMCIYKYIRYGSLILLLFVGMVACKGKKETEFMGVVPLSRSMPVGMKIWIVWPDKDTSFLMKDSVNNGFINSIPRFNKADTVYIKNSVPISYDSISLVPIQHPKNAKYPIEIGDTVIVPVIMHGNSVGIVRAKMPGKMYISYFNCNCNTWYPSSEVFPFSLTW